MVTTLTDAGTATRAEVFHVPNDYPVVETEDGSLLEHGWYWWYIQDNGAPDGYPIGKFESKIDALEDWSMAGSYEPAEED